MMKEEKYCLIRDLAIIAVSIIAAVILAKTGAFEKLLTSTKEIKFIGSFIAGIFFTSVFTTAPATVALAEIAKSNSIISVALLGGAGALIGDMVIFRFVENNISKDLVYLSQRSGFKKFASIFKTKLLRRLMPLIGALIVASPLPDEPGLVLMGLSKVKMPAFILISFALNSAGILIIGLIAKSLA